MAGLALAKPKFGFFLLPLGNLSQSQKLELPSQSEQKLPGWTARQARVLVKLRMHV